MGNSNTYSHVSKPVYITSSRINLGLYKQQFKCDEKDEKVQQYLTSLSSLLTKTECQRIANRITKQKQGESFSEIVTFQSTGSASRTSFHVLSKKDKLGIHVTIQNVTVVVTFNAEIWHLKNDAELISSKPRALNSVDIAKLTAYLKKQCENVATVKVTDSEANVYFRNDSKATKTKILFNRKETFVALQSNQMKYIQLNKLPKKQQPKDFLEDLFAQPNYL
jgi:hypothetical protein